MKSLLHISTLLLLALLATQSLLAESEIKLTGRKDLVLSVESRASVLNVARLHLREKSDAFLALAAEVDTPYAFEQPVVALTPDGEAEPVEEVTINYDDASVLRAVSVSFAKQVRGTLARGNTSFLQLTGGNMIKPGTSFPVSIPQAQGQTFTITITEVTSDDYTLKLGEATQTIRLNSSGSGSGAIRLD
ncbi:hypothetical protein ACWPKO_09695 [Coraliomargarita sp. W4R53]